MTKALGKLYLMPNTLDFGTDGALPSLEETLAPAVIRIASRIEHWVVESAKSTRHFLKRVNAVVPLTRRLQDIEIFELPRPVKGRPNAPSPQVTQLLAPAMKGQDMALLSEAGLPAVADPGASLIQLAHGHGIEVVALPGASSLLLALAASGLNGQGFSFVGYLPIGVAERARRIRELETESAHDGQTRLMIEVPYRNQALLDALVEQLRDTTLLSVSSGLTLAGGFSRTDRVAAWRRAKPSLPGNIPAVFLLLAPGDP
ncbi:MAG: SAM-dependent methyltransferase [Burkholderiaceae bacterium]